VISYTWSVIHDPETACSKMNVVAGKLNRPKSRSTSRTWDLAYLHSYFSTPADLEPSLCIDAFKEHTGRAICLVKGATGWRAADLAGVYLEESFVWVPQGVFIKNYNTKTRIGKWSERVLIPKLNKAHNVFSAYHAIRVLQKLLLDYIVKMGPTFNYKNATIKSSSIRSGEVQDTSFFNWMHKGGVLKPLAPSTISGYFTKAFLDNVIDSSTDAPLSEVHNQHSSRHAVASMLNDMGVPAASIAAITLNSAQTLQQTYIVPVERHYPLPLRCLENQPDNVAKLLLPFVHWHTSDKFIKENDNAEDIVIGTCKCSLVLFSSNPSVGDCEQSVE
jgi:hypothetical protein